MSCNYENIPVIIQRTFTAGQKKHLLPPTAHHETQLHKRAHTVLRNQSLWFIAWFSSGTSSSSSISKVSLINLASIADIYILEFSFWSWIWKGFKILVWSLIFKLIPDPGFKSTFKILIWALSVKSNQYEIKPLNDFFVNFCDVCNLHNLALCWVFCCYFLPKNQPCMK